MTDSTQSAMPKTLPESHVPPPPRKRGRPKKEKPQLTTSQGFPETTSTTPSDFMIQPVPTQDVVQPNAHEELRVLLERIALALEVGNRKTALQAEATEELVEQVADISDALARILTLANAVFLGSLGASIQGAAQ